MDKLEYESFIGLKIRDITAIVMERKDYDFETAIDYLYRSGLYRMLILEDTKLWHLSNEKLFEMLEGEKENKKLIFPDYV